MNKADEQRIDTFLIELTELTKRHRIQVSGCGCCGSPYLLVDFDCRKGEIDLNWDKEKQTYTIN